MTRYRASIATGHIMFYVEFFMNFEDMDEAHQVGRLMADSITGSADDLVSVEVVP